MAVFYKIRLLKKIVCFIVTTEILIFVADTFVPLVYLSTWSDVKVIASLRSFRLAISPTSSLYIYVCLCAYIDN